MIECLKAEDGLQWMYAPARFTFLATMMDHQGERVWEVPLRVGAADREFVSEITVERILLDTIRVRVRE